MNNIGETLRSYRKAKGLTQQDIAERSGLSRITVNRIERGGVDALSSTLQTYAQALNADFLVVPKELREQLDAFVKSGGKLVGQVEGSGAPKSAVQIALEGSASK